MKECNREKAAAAKVFNPHRNNFFIFSCWTEGRLDESMTSDHHLRNKVILEDLGLHAN